VSGRGLPDFLLLALLLIAMRSKPGTAAVAGLVIGFVTDVLTPAHFGAGMLAHVLVGFVASWGRAVFFADNLLVNFGLFFLGTWLRNVLMLTFSGTSFGELAEEATVWAPVQGLTTAVAGVNIVSRFRDWLVVRNRT
jgi:rod shape-determining protein MreD